MVETVRCTSCRGAKKVPKLGGVIGECNTCKGKGTILLSDKVKVVINEPVVTNDNFIKAVSEAIPFAINKDAVLSADDKPFEGVVIVDDPLANRDDSVVTHDVISNNISMETKKENLKKTLYKRKTTTDKK